MSFAESKPTPSLKTISTFLMSATSTVGLPLMTTTSAALPTAKLPMRASSPRNVAPFEVAIRIASSGGGEHGAVAGRIQPG